MKMNGIQASLLGLLVCVVALRTSSAQAAKPGVCPLERFFNSTYAVKTESCREDSDCPGNKKCCSDNGFKFCKPPAKRRIGSCPVNPSGTAISERCDDMCTADSECAPKTKCCLKGCGKTCVPSNGDKKGFCGLEGYCLIAERPHCDTDAGCPGFEKCCRPGCTQTCVKPLKERIGICPKVSKLSEEPQDSLTEKEERCNTDYDCENPKKCCKTIWGKRCTAPLYD
ncbi:whey acidic protein-like [Bufo bufo]|uniref:whey acidic protein-like n=1 Tax=Bufo bufo TaxID=8384 RepID=UPI001ABE9B60|nr:whey acidic protein-like [Bufo bufo]